MEENNNKKCDCLMCKCCGMAHKAFGGENCGKHRLLRWIIGLLILWAVFALGVKVGELKYTIKDGLRSGGYYGMMGGDNDGRFFPNMMYYWNSKLQSATSTK